MCAISTAPFFIFASSFLDASPSMIGRWTLNTMSAVFNAVAASLAMVAPASLNAASVKEASTPAPFSTTTVKPKPTSFFTKSGEAATRVSPGRRSFGMAIFMIGNYPLIPKVCDAPGLCL